MAEQIKEVIKKEYIKCAQDPAYFMKKYCMIQHPIRGKIPFELYDFQEKSVNEFHQNRFNVILKARQLGISTLTAGYSLWNCIGGLIPGSVGETSIIAVLIGAFILISTGVGSWRTMLSCVIGAVVMAGIFNLFASDSTIPFLQMSPLWHLVIGSFAFGAVFMATDPVSSPDLNQSKWIYGFMIGVLTIIIRSINPAYPEGIMLAILLMNAFAPLIDYYVVQSNIKKRLVRYAQ